MAIFDGNRRLSWKWYEMADGYYRTLYEVMVAGLNGITFDDLQ